MPDRLDLVNAGELPASIAPHVPGDDPFGREGLRSLAPAESEMDDR